MGCHLALSPDKYLFHCAFAHNRFTLPSGERMTPCYSSYHTRCLRVGPPFTTRLKAGAGLSFPRVQHWGTFICELCTVWAVVGRELRCATDSYLLHLERMRLIDMANAWATGTHTQYQQKLAVIRQFEMDYSFSFLNGPPLTVPPTSPDIPLMWIHESYSLRSSSRNKERGQVATAAIRHLRSAASQFLGWEMMVRHPTSTVLDQQHRVLQQPCRATDCYSFSLFSKGLSSRLGTDSTPAVPLLFRHVRYMDLIFDPYYGQADTYEAQRQWALAGMANLLFWLGWLRSGEVFGLTWDNVKVVQPADGPIYDIPSILGMTLLRLLPQTKTNRSATADVVLAYTTASGLSLGRWCQCLAKLVMGTQH